MRDFSNMNAFQTAKANLILDQNKERNERLKPIEDNLKDYYLIDEIWEVNDFQIARVRRKKAGKEWLYPTFLHYKPLHEVGMTFDQAILICLAAKYEGNSHSMFPIYAARMLNANFMPELEEGLN